MAQFWAMGIVSGATRHPSDVPFVREFWWSTVSHRKTPILAIGSIFFMLAVHGS